MPPSHIKIQLIDNTKFKINAYYDEEPLINKISDRSFMNISFENINFNKEKELLIIKEFNNKIKDKR